MRINITPFIVLITWVFLLKFVLGEFAELMTLFAETFRLGGM